MSNTTKKMSALPVAAGKTAATTIQASDTTDLELKTQDLRDKAIQLAHQLELLAIKTPPSKVQQLKTSKPPTTVFKALSDTHKNELERKIGHIFADPNLLWEALQAHGNGISQIGSRKIGDGNKKMAMLGDSILQLAVLRDWFSSGDSRRSGHDHLVGIASNRNLAKCGRDNELEKYINPHKSFKRGEIPPKTMAATVEAIVGAVFVDSGENLKAVKGAMVGLGLV